MKLLLLQVEIVDPKSFYSIHPPDLQKSHELLLKSASFDWLNENGNGNGAVDALTIRDFSIDIKRV
jgi:hypothetical protein